jgi:two-component system NtrC family response regulator
MYPFTQFRRVNLEKVLIIDDDPAVRRGIAIILRDAGFATLTAPGGEKGIECCRTTPPDAIILDLTMPGMNGMDTLSAIRELQRDIPVIIHTGTGDITRAVAAMRLGASDFLEKPVNAETLILSLEKAVSLKRLKRQNTYLAGQYMEKMGLADMVAESKSMKDILQTADRLAPASGLHILIQGDSGTGKELLARYIHCRSPRMAAPFVAFNCAAMPEELLASELFGYTAGAFTSANPKGRSGKFAQANGGTLFLDEIGEIPLSLQSILLRVLDNGEYSPIGSEETIHGDFRILSATNRNLQEMVRAGQFREELLFRLSGFSLHLEPLCKRVEDIEPMIRLFTRQACERMGMNELALTDDAIKALCRENWPGNARELKNTIERAAVMNFPDSILSMEIIMDAISANGSDSLRNNAEPNGESILSEESEFSSQQIFGMKLPKDGFDLETLTLRIIGAAYLHCQRDIPATAKYLGITKDALRYRLRRLSGLSRK